MTGTRSSLMAASRNPEVVRAPCKPPSWRRWHAPPPTSCQSCERSASRSARWTSKRKPNGPRTSPGCSRRFTSTTECAGITSQKPRSSERSTCRPRSVAPSESCCAVPAWSLSTRTKFSRWSDVFSGHALVPGMFKKPVRDGPRRMEGIQIYELKRMDLRGATVIDGFPSVGLVSSIVANYLINALSLTQIGIMDSVYFPTVALVRDGQPMNPVRIYAGPKVDDHDQIVVFISEFQPPPNLIKAIAATVLDWAQDARCNLLVCPEGLIVDAREDEAERQVEGYGVGSTDKAMDMIRQNDITVFEEGVITGVDRLVLY